MSTGHSTAQGTGRVLRTIFTYTRGADTGIFTHLRQKSHQISRPHCTTHSVHRPLAEHVCRCQGQHDFYHPGGTVSMTRELLAL